MSEQKKWTIDEAEANFLVAKHKLQAIRRAERPKKERTEAQKEATARMLEANKARKGALVAEPSKR